MPPKDVEFEFEVICVWDLNKERRTPPNASKMEGEGYLPKTENSCSGEMEKLPVN